MKKQSTNDYLDPLHSIGYLTRINFRAFSKALSELTEKHGVTAGQWRFLRVLWEEDGITQRLLAQRVGITEATAVNGINGLEAGGFVERSVDKADKRKMIVRLTPYARRLKKKLIPMVVDVNERALRGIDPKDVETARKVLVATYTNLSEENET